MVLTLCPTIFCPSLPGVALFEASTSALSLPTLSRAQLCCLGRLPTWREEKQGDFDCTLHFAPPPPPSWRSLPFSPQDMAEEQSHSRSVVSGNLWFLGREHRKGFFPPVAEEMKKLSIAILNCSFCF